MSVDTLSLCVTPVSIDGRAGFGLVARPGWLIALPLPAGATVGWLQARASEPPEGLIAEPGAWSVALAGVLGVEHRHTALRRQEHLTVRTAAGEALVARPGKPSEPEWLRQAAERAFGFRWLTPHDTDDVILDLAVEDSPVRVNLIHAAGTCWLFDVPPASVTTYGPALLKSSASFLIAGIGSIAANDSGGAQTPGELRLGAYLRGLRKGRHTPSPPAGLGLTQGRITGAVIDELAPGTLRLELQVDGRAIVLRCDPKRRPAIRRFLTGSLGPAVTAAAP